MSIRIVEFKSQKGLEIGFVGLEEWDDFEIICEVLQRQLNCKVIEKYDGPYSRFCKLIKDNVEFRLMQHPDLGNALLAIEQSETNNEMVKTWAHEVITLISDSKIN